MESEEYMNRKSRKQRLQRLVYSSASLSLSLSSSSTNKKTLTLEIILLNDGRSDRWRQIGSICISMDGMDAVEPDGDAF